VFSDYDYLHEVWMHHQAIVNAITNGDVDTAYQWLVRHTGLLQQHPRARAGAVAEEAHQPAVV
jgi:DNA-binding GntR family transcriptional regulator